MRVRYVRLGPFVVLVRAAVVALSLAVLAACSSPGDHIEGAVDGRVDGLVVKNGDFDRWFVPQVQGVRATPDGRTLTFVYYAARCDRGGLVGSAIHDGKGAVRLTVVAGESGSGCDTMLEPHDARIRLSSPLGSRRVVFAQPKRP